MEDWYNEYIRIVRMEYFVKDKLKLAIDKIKEEKEANNLSAVDTLTLVDKEIRMLLTNLRKTDACIMIDYIASVKKPFVEITIRSDFLYNSRTISFKSVRINGSPPVILVKYILGNFLIVSMLISSSGLDGAL